MVDAVLDSVKSTVKHFDYLAGRWEDEREYEDFNDYTANFVKNFPDFKIVKSSKRPFSFTIVHKDAPNRNFVLKATAKSLTLQEYAR
jgi:hypothetical protein